MNGLRTNQIDDDPRLIALCVNCTNEDCSGECEAYYTMRNQITGGSVAVYTCDGVTLTLKGWAKRIGISPEGLYHRIARQGYTFEDAVRLGPAKKTAKYEAFGKSMTISEWAQEYGINEYTLRRRLRVGQSFEKALTEKVRPTYERRLKNART